MFILEQIIYFKKQIMTMEVKRLWRITSSAHEVLLLARAVNIRKRDDLTMLSLHFKRWNDIHCFIR